VSSLVFLASYCSVTGMSRLLQLGVG